jgi:3-oxoacyl-[acyl-carrier protein] reductase
VSDDRKWVFVAGGSGAIGSEICRVLADAGWDTVVTYRNNQAAAESVVADVTARGRDAVAVQVDLADSAAVTAAVQSTGGTGDPLHAVVYAAGPFFLLDYISNLSSERFAAQMAGDTVAAYNVLQSAIAPLRQTRGSMVALVTSANRRYMVTDVLSSAPKAAVEAIVKAIAAEEARNGIRANGIGVGVIDAGIWTEIAQQLDWPLERHQAAVKSIPLGRLGTPTDVAGAVEFFVSERASWITGQVLDLDGGHSI